MVEKTHIFNANIEKQLLLEYNQKSKTKSQEWSNLAANKTSLMTVIYGQCNNVARTKITLQETYEADCQAANIINFLKRLCTVCYKSDDGGLFFKRYKQVISVKLLNNFSNNKLNNPHGFKEEIKIK